MKLKQHFCFCWEKHFDALFSFLYFCLKSFRKVEGVSREGGVIMLLLATAVASFLVAPQPKLLS